jgi:uncharacterized protein (DUF342 family)
MNDHENPGPAIALKVSDDDQQLIAVVPAGDNIASLTAQGLVNMIKGQGFADWQSRDAAMADAVASLGTLTEQTEFIVAERVDGTLQLQVTDDAHKALLSIKPPHGGAPVTEAQVMAALQAEGVSHGIKTEAIKAALQSGATENAVIAEATLPTAGTDTVFESLIPAVKHAHPKINEDGRADYHEIGALITVAAGDKVMRKHPPTSGTHGVDVRGQVITATAGKDLNFKSGLSGVAPDPADKNILLASIGGRPVLVENGVEVSHVITVKNVDIASGNIHFVGTVNIQGDVMEGMQVQATDDIIISGMVEGAELEAGGDITINKGVIGRGEVRTESGEPGHGVAKLNSGGSITARFIENALVEAAGNVTVGELVSHCEISSLQQVIVGKKGAKKGHILGGKTRATLGIEAQVIGSQSDVKTIIAVGNNPNLHKQVRQLRAQLEENEEEKLKLLTLISRLRLQADTKSKLLLARVLATQDKLLADSQALEDEIKTLEKQDELNNSAKVKIGKHAFSGVTITICDKEYIVQDRTVAGEFSLVNGKVEFEYR